MPLINDLTNTPCATTAMRNVLSDSDMSIEALLSYSLKSQFLALRYAIAESASRSDPFSQQLLTILEEPRISAILNRVEFVPDLPFHANSDIQLAMLYALSRTETVLSNPEHRMHHDHQRYTSLCKRPSGEKILGVYSALVRAYPTPDVAVHPSQGLHQ